MKELRAWFEPERPGPLIYSHIVRTGVGHCRVDRWPDPAVVHAELPGGNHALRGDPDRFDPTGTPVGLVEAPPDWLPALRRADPATGIWERLIATLPDAADPPAPGVEVRRLTAADAGLLAGLHPDIAWIHETWDGAAVLAASGLARAVVVDGRAVSLAVPFYFGEQYEDIGVVTEPDHRGRGLSTACTATLIADIRSRGARPSWTTSPDNAASLAVAARLGFVRAREDVLYAVGVPVPGG